MSQACSSDGTFGPTIGSTCRGGFDFTLTFEESVLGLLPQAIFLLLAPVRLLTLWRRRSKVVKTSHLGFLKLVSSILYAASTLALLVYWTKVHDAFRTKSSIAAAAVEFAGSLTVLLLSRLEHTRAVRPSHLLQFFLMVMVACDAVRLRTLFLMEYPSGLVATASVHTFLTGWILMLESLDKTALFKSGQRPLAPEDTIGLFTERLFLWLNKLFKEGYAKVLKPTDLYDMDEELTSQELQDHFVKTWDAYPHKHRKNALVFIIAKTLTRNLVSPMLPRLLYVGTEVAQPFLISRAIQFIEASREEQSINIGYGLIAAFGLNYTFRSIFFSWSNQAVARFRIQLRACLITAIYERTLRIAPKNVDLASATTLMNVDVEKIMNSTKFIHIYWSTPIQAAIALYLLWRRLGVVFVAPLIILFAAVSISMQIGTIARGRQRLWVGATQERVTNISYMAGCIKAIRMLGLSETVHRTLELLRETEIGFHSYVRKAQVWILTLSNSMFLFATLATYIPFAIINMSNGTSFGYDTMLTSLSALKLVTTPLLMLMQNIMNVIAGLASLDRIQDYLNNDTVSQEVIEESLRSGIDLKDECIMRLDDATFAIDTSKALLSNIDLKVYPGQLVMTVGKVASGKSVLVRSLIRETHLVGGSCHINPGGIAFCPQTPWLRNTTLRDNILGLSEFDRKWYNTVVWACGLNADFAELKEGDATKVGSKGVSLSGGQKNRVSLARSLYSRKRVLVLDDVLAGLDNSTEKLVFSRVFGHRGLLRKSSTTAILATHSIHHAHEADHVVILEDGRVLAQGSYETLIASNDYLRKLAPKSEGFKQGTNEEDAMDTALDQIESRQSALSERDRPTDPYEVGEDSDRRSGDFGSLVFYVKAVGRQCAITYFVLLVLSQGALAVQMVFIKLWAGSNDNSRSGMIKWLSLFIVVTLITVGLLGAWIGHGFLVWTKRSSLTLHSVQLKAFMGATYAALVSMDIGSITNRFSQDMVLVDSMLQMSWINASGQIATVTAEVGIAIAATYPVAALLPFLITICWAVQRVYLRTSRQIRLMDIEAKAPLCTHFLETLSGIMSVRAFGWSKTLADQNAKLLEQSQVPLYLLWSIQNWLTLVLQLIVAGIVVVVVGSGVALRDSVDPGFLGLALVTIMDMSETLFNLVVFWTELEMSLSAVQRILKFSTRTPQEPSKSGTSLIDDLPTENSKGSIAFADWPTSGNIDFVDLTAGYSPTADPVLHQVGLSIRAGEKVGICGRTGSGKSSLVAALFGLLEQRHAPGSDILIDDVSTRNVPLETLRSSIVALPQEPFFLPGTVRENLLPWTVHQEKQHPSRDQQDHGDIELSERRFSDAELESALAAVHLLPKLRALATEQNIPLFSLPLSSLDSVLSAGERQLFCLARATLMNDRKIVVLDEATSNVDRDTDTLMQGVLREAFKGKTIIAIAHRLDTILDFDRIVVMDAGRIVEVGPPGELLEMEGGRFRSLVEAQKGMRGSESESSGSGSG